MKTVKDFTWKQDMTVEQLVDNFGSVGYQAIELYEASQVILKMKKSGAKIFLTFTSNMVTSGLRGFFAQLIELKMADILVTTSGSIEEDIIKSLGDNFEIRTFNADDNQLHEQGENRIGNLVIKNESYMKFEDWMSITLEDIYKTHKRIAAADLLKEIGLRINKPASILHQAAKNNVPIFCPGIADSAFGFHLFLFQQKHPDFVVDTLADMKKACTDLSFDDKKGLISLGGSISKHYAVFSALLSGGMDYAVYMTSSHPYSGSFAGATTNEAKSWGKIKDDAEAATVIGDVSINFPLVMTSVLDKLSKEGFLDE
ncbi:deoxyhypusine synthase family protein [Candidatus Woesearchaeota archaeon]|jgi:deoxyhypusine synthase|nr:deoxyhypusine synthase family protein [Candidatus Woesearchaeota archaeon]MBT3304765.1 deoxyhypusine synthase family protein [Candidatus Woesearchaeota archaeon]MBT4367899.1 deoxyhypusine synthase family protein [Candidatus Woesearchaeota archaeon]MBT4712387.1 deoxyhypusine synthase family protein [Candidatus Woesearchaeota archaeon]MBT6639299.1 deoxyhypusine synthase family protein [Candidatus Woesearchaeota archaeon]